jgi:hypothetical protein
LSALFYKRHYWCLKHITISVIHSLLNTNETKTLPHEMATSRILYYRSRITYNQSNYVDTVIYAKDYFHKEHPLFRNENASFVLNHKHFCPLLKQTNKQTNKHVVFCIKTWSLLLLIYTISGCTDRRRRVSVATKFCRVAPYITGPPAWTLLHAIILAPRIFGKSVHPCHIRCTTNCQITDRDDYYEPPQERPLPNWH